MSDTVLTFRDFYMRLFAAGDADAVRLKPYAKRLRATHEPIEKNIAKAIGSAGAGSG